MVDDPGAIESQLSTAAGLHRAWLVRVLRRTEIVVPERKWLLAAVTAAWRVLLHLVHAHQWAGECDRVAHLQNEALELTDTPARRASTAQPTGERPFNQSGRRSAPAEFGAALTIRTGANRDLITSSAITAHPTRETVGRR